MELSGFRFLLLMCISTSYIISLIFSTLSSVLNAVALVILEDFIRPFNPTLEEKTATRITKGISLAVGGVGIGLVFIISQVKTILEVQSSYYNKNG